MDLFINESATILEAMKKLDITTKKILYVVSNNILLASITDGDIRRHLLKSGNLSDLVSKVANYSPKYIYQDEETNVEAIMKKFDITSVPVVNETKEVISIKFLDSKTQNAYAIVGLPVVIMAGGKGTRLYPYTQILPKPLLPIGELPIVEHIMNSFRGFSCEDFHLIVNHKKQMIKAYFADEDNKSKVSFYDEDIPLGTGGGLSLLKGHINETFFLTNCDIILKADYSDILEFHKKNHNTITIVCAYKHFQIPYGVIKMGDNGTIDEMVEKPEYSFLTNTGFYVVEPDVIASIKKDENISFPEIIENQIKNAKSVRIYPVSEKSWLDMGEFSQMEEMKKELGV